MKIAIIGIGNVGGALAGNWAAKGHSIFFGVADPKNEEVKALVKSVPNSRAGSNREAISYADVSVLAVPFDAVRSVLADCGDLTRKIILDCTNPLTPDFRNLRWDSPPRAASWSRRGG